MSKFTTLAKHFATDRDAEKDGKWFDYPGSPIRVKLRRATDHKFKQVLRRKASKFPHLTPQIEQLVKMEATAETLVADWELPEQIECTPGNVLEAFKEMPDFYRWCEGESDSFENFRIEQVGEDAGPLSGTSTGSTSGEAIQTASPSSNAEPAGA